MRWVLACAIGEAIGISVVAMAFWGGADLPFAGGAALILAGGAVEGLSIGAAQALGARDRGVHAQGWIMATVAAAVAGYALSIAGQAAFQDQSATVAGGDAGPPIALVLAGGAPLGLTMGCLFGAAQAFGAAPRELARGAWIVRNTGGWAAAMPVIMLSATLIPADASLFEVGMLGAATGGCAGLLLGLATVQGLPPPPPRGI